MNMLINILIENMILKYIEFLDFVNYRRILRMSFFYYLFFKFLYRKTILSLKKIYSEYENKYEIYENMLYRNVNFVTSN